MKALVLEMAMSNSGAEHSGLPLADSMLPYLLFILLACSHNPIIFKGSKHLCTIILSGVWIHLKNRSYLELQSTSVAKNKVLRTISLSNY